VVVLPYFFGSGFAALVTRTPDIAQELVCGHRWDLML
jgi:hypothetical protein